MLMFSATVSISVLPDRLYKVTVPAGVTPYYCAKDVTNAYFVANGSTTLVLQSASAITGSISVVEYQRSYYDAYDGQGGTWAYQPSQDRWTSQYSFRPEWMTLVGNRLVSFKGGKPYVHNGVSNTFYGQAYDSVVALVHSDATNQIKSYMAFSVEGNTPDLLHCRTEVPNVQSTDLRAADFAVIEGVKTSALLRDRLSPNAAGTYDQKLYTGDRIKGENALFQCVFFNPTTSRYINFVNITFIPSLGHETE